MRQSFGEQLLTGWFLAFLVGASLAVSIPAGLRARRDSPFSSAQLYKKRMSMMAPRSRGGRWVIVPDGHSEAQARAMARRARRRQSRILTGLIAAAFITGIWAFGSGGGALHMHVFVDVVTIAYGGVVIHARRRQAERRRKVRSLARHPLNTQRSSWPDLDRESVAL